MGLFVSGTILFGIAESTRVEGASTVGGLLWLAALVGVAMAAWLTQFEVVEPDE